MESGNDQRGEFTLSLLGFIAEHDMYEVLYWRTDGEYAPIRFWINANDVISWSCADLVEINAQTLPILRECVADCEAIDLAHGAIYGCVLFACRVNNSRPQGAAYPRNRDLWPLFDACGPERELGIGNPFPPGGRR